MASRRQLRRSRTVRRVRSTCVQPIRTRLQGNLPSALPLPCLVEDAELCSKRTTQAELLGNGHALPQQGCLVSHPLVCTPRLFLFCAAGGARVVSSQDRRGIRLVLIGVRSCRLDVNQQRRQVVFMHDCRSRVPIPLCGQAWGGSLTHARCTQCRIRSGDIEGGKGETYPRRRSVARCVSRGASALRGGTACVRTKVQAAQKVTQDRRARRRREGR